MIELNHHIMHLKCILKKCIRNAFLFCHAQGKPRNGNISETMEDTKISKYLFYEW